jgi:DNA repair exonuclease SbcCD ATPase subunit
MNQPQTPDNEVGNQMKTNIKEVNEHINNLNNEVARLRERLEKAEDLIRGLHDGWKKARKAHLETCKNAQAEIDKLHTENVCLQELIQEFYEWSRRDYPTEAEVREIMDRYYNLLNK